MAWFAAWAPYIMAAVGQISNMQGQRSDAAFDSKMAKAQGKAATDQALRDEEQVRRESAAVIGNQAAAAAESGVSTAGSTGMLIDQSTELAELDALNTRYAGQLRSKGLLAEAASARQSRRNALPGGLLLAGSTLLSKKN